MSVSVCARSLKCVRLSRCKIGSKKAVHAISQLCPILEISFFGGVSHNSCQDRIPERRNTHSSPQPRNDYSGIKY